MSPALPRGTGVCLDCDDAEELAGFYGRLLGWEIKDGDGAGWLTAGAREAVPQPADRSRDRLRIMLDPAGHPFCLCTD